MLFEDVPAAKNSEASDYRKTTKAMWLENEKLPDYRIGKKCQRNESVFSKISTRPDTCQKTMILPAALSDLAILRTIGKLPDVPIIAAPRKMTEEETKPNDESEGVSVAAAPIESEPKSIKQQFSKRQKTDEEVPSLRQPQKEEPDTAVAAEDPETKADAQTSNKWAQLYSSEAPTHNKRMQKAVNKLNEKERAEAKKLAAK